MIFRWPLYQASAVLEQKQRRRGRKVDIPHDKELCRQRHKIENMFGRLKDWRRIATRYDRCAHTFFSAVCIAATVAFSLSSMGPEPSALLHLMSHAAHLQHFETSALRPCWRVLQLRRGIPPSSVA